MADCEGDAALAGLCWDVEGDALALEVGDAVGIAGSRSPGDGVDATTPIGLVDGRLTDGEWPHATRHSAVAAAIAAYDFVRLTQFPPGALQVAAARPKG